MGLAVLRLLVSAMFLIYNSQSACDVTQKAYLAYEAFVQKAMVHASPLLYSVEQALQYAVENFPKSCDASVTSGSIPNTV